MREAVEETATGITFRLRTPTWVRVVFVAIAVLPLVAPYELLIKPRWNGTLSPAMIIPLIISAGAVAVSAGLVAAAGYGVSQRVRVDFAGRVVRFALIAPLQRLALRRYPFAAVRAVHGWREAGADGPDSYGLRIEFADGSGVRIGPTQSAAKAREWLALLRQRGGLPAGDAAALEGTA
jgi:hypothetical protein